MQTAEARGELRLVVNGTQRHVLARPAATLLEVLRDDLALTGTKLGCGTGTCGCCAVLVDGVARLSCLTLAATVEGARVRTIEGVAGPAGLHPLQEALVAAGATQCGFCTPGIVMTALALLEEHRDPSEDTVREALSGNLCRCTGYVKIVEAVRNAAATLRGLEPLPEATK